MYICENQNGFVLYSSINHSRISVLTYSAKYQIIVYRPGGECNSTIYCSNINCSVKYIGLEALRKVGTIIYNPEYGWGKSSRSTDLGRPVDRRPNFCVDLLYSHRSSPVCDVNQDRAFHNH